MPKGSLQYIYHPDDSDKKGGFASVSVTEETLTVTFFNYKGDSFLPYKRHTYKTHLMCVL